MAQTFASLEDLLKKVHAGVALITFHRRAEAPSYRFATFGRTRARKDGTLQIGRRDQQVLSELVTLSGQADAPGVAAKAEDPAWQARAAKAFDNVVTAHLRRLTHPAQPEHSHFRALLADSALAAGVGGTIAGIAGRLGVIQPTWDYLRMVANAGTRGLAGKLVPSTGLAGRVMAWTHGSWEQSTMVAAGAAAVVAGGVAAVSSVGQAWDKSKRFDVMGHGVEGAWTRAHAAQLRAEVGVENLVPEQDSPGRFSWYRSVDVAERLGEQLAEYSGYAKRPEFVTESDWGKRFVLNEMVSEPPDKRPNVAIALLAEESKLPKRPELAKKAASEGQSLWLSPDEEDAVVRNFQMRTARDGQSRQAPPSAVVGAVHDIREVGKLRGITGLFPDLPKMPADVDQASAVALSGTNRAGQMPMPQGGQQSAARPVDERRLNAPESGRG